VDTVPELMAAADIVVTKSGGLATAECLAAGKPMVISGSIPGQEERNADFVVESGAGVRALTPEEIRWRVTRWLADPAQLAAVAERARAVARPDAADHVADLVARAVGADATVAGPRFHGAL
jgi:processive 1,2-diacylglycerol beta-glucosyltransferase